MNTIDNHAAPYAANFKAWSTKLLGDKPTAEQLAVAHAFGKPGKQSLAVAMALRDIGASDPQVQLAVSLNGGLARPQNNHRGNLVKSGMFKREMVAPVNGYTVYKINLTPKGQAFIERRNKALATTASELAKPVAKAKPAKAAATKKPASKPRKAKVVVPTEPVTDTMPVTDLPPIAQPELTAQPAA